MSSDRVYHVAITDVRCERDGGFGGYYGLNLIGLHSEPRVPYQRELPHDFIQQAIRNLVIELGLEEPDGDFDVVIRDQQELDV